MRKGLSAPAGSPVSSPTAALAAPAARGLPTRRLWIASLLACAVLSVLSAGQIYLRRSLAGDLPSLSNQLLLNFVAWLPVVAVLTNTNAKGFFALASSIGEAVLDPASADD